MSERSRIIYDSTLLSGSRVIIMVIGFLKSIILARIFIPSLYGILNFVNLILSYNKYTSIGLKSAAFREVPYFIGRGNRTEALILQNLSITINFIISFLVTLGILLVVLIKDFEPYIELALIVSAFLFTLYSICSFYEMKATFLKDFKFISNLRLLDIILKFIIVILAGILFGLRGALFSLILIQLIILFYAFKKIDLEFKPKLDIVRLMNLARIGIPLFFSGIVWNLFLTADSFLVMRYLGKEKFGYYSLAILFLSFFYNISSDTGSVIFQYTQEHYGNMNDSFALKKYIERPTKVIAYYFPLIIALVLFLIDLPIRWVLPHYIQSINVIKVLIYAYFFILLSMFHSALLTTLNRQVFHFFIRLFFVFFLIVLTIFLIKSGFGILGVALGATISWILYSLTVFFVTVGYIIKEKKEKLFYTGEIFFPIIYSSLLIIFGFFFQNYLGGELKFILPPIIFMVCYLPLVISVDRKLGLLESLVKIISNYKQLLKI